MAEERKQEENVWKGSLKLPAGEKEAFALIMKYAKKHGYNQTIQRLKCAWALYFIRFHPRNDIEVEAMRAGFTEKECEAAFEGCKTKEEKKAVLEGYIALEDLDADETQQASIPAAD